MTAPTVVPISGLPAGSTLADDDIIPFVDISDLSEAPTGTTKRIAIADLRIGLNTSTVAGVGFVWQTRNLAGTLAERMGLTSEGVLLIGTDPDNTSSALLRLTGSVLVDNVVAVTHAGNVARLSVSATTFGERLGGGLVSSVSGTVANMFIGATGTVAGAICGAVYYDGIMYRSAWEIQHTGSLPPGTDGGKGTLKLMRSGGDVTIGADAGGSPGHLIIRSLAGNGQRAVVVDANGQLSAP